MVPLYLSLYWLYMSPIPKYFVGLKPATVDPDADWMRHSETLPAEHFNPHAKKLRYIPAIPMEFIQQSLIAGDALALLLVALAEMRMCGASEIALGPAMWAKIGNPSKRVRARLLRQIAWLPENLCVLFARKGRPHLLKTGPGWPCGIKERPRPTA
ncbi:hypothetical protein E3V39_13075 [Gammaproteobacteria bacterium LSUCC0112]|nr:hypothetical protein E3V39_13075 [Gammaproteobacteria bacterium LSUCC0112]